MTCNDAYPLPRAQDCLEAMAGPRMLSTMDIMLEENQATMAEKDIAKTVFTTKYGLFEFKTMPFGPMTAPITN